MLKHGAVATIILCAFPLALKAEEPLFTPQRALELFLDDELQFVSRFRGDDIGLMDWVCLFKNKHVLVRLSYCTKIGGGERYGSEVVGAKIYSAKGEEIYVYAETSAEESVFRTMPTSYTRFTLDYRDLSKAKGATRTVDMDVPSYVQFMKASNDLPWRSYDVCFLKSYPFSVIPKKKGPVKVDCPYSQPPFRTAWQNSGEQLVSSFPKTWFRFLRTAEVLVDRHGK